MIAKEHISMLANGKACGRRYRVRCLSGTNKAIRNACTGKTVDVKVIGSCEKCSQNELVLSQEAFAKIARLALGRVNINYEQYVLTIIDIIYVLKVFTISFVILLIGNFLL
ncbi:putative rlpA-like protein, double-psi beta-barrel [Helianthus anomalus]